MRWILSAGKTAGLHMAVLLALVVIAAFSSYVFLKENDSAHSAHIFFDKIPWVFGGYLVAYYFWSRRRRVARRNNPRSGEPKRKRALHPDSKNNTCSSDSKPKIAKT